jgi:hypothetical protein
MKNKAPVLFAFLLLLANAPGALPFDLWQNPEMAERDTVFVGGFAASFSYSYTQLGAFKFGFSAPEIFFDLMLPLPLPFSLGVSAGLMEPGVLGGGARLGYHVNVGDPNLDVYALYELKLKFVEDVSAEIEWFPAIGARRKFGSFFCVNLETGSMGKALLIGFSVKLN